MLNPVSRAASVAGETGSGILFSIVKKTNNLKPYLPLFALFLFAATTASAQKIDSIYFNLYTDSLKKGTFNYINVDGLLSNGRYLPLNNKIITFSATAGRFEGNSLWIDKSFAEEKISITAVLNSNPRITKNVIIYIKKKEDDEVLRTVDEILKTNEGATKKKKKGS
jgi:hypothetical protein